MSVLSTGSVLGDFRVEDEVGRGGMGVVYRAVQISLGRPVALKVIAGTLSDNVAFRDRFVRESRLTASLDHPNVIPVFAAGEADGVLYIAMRFVEGTDLRSLIAAEGRLEPLRAAGVVAQVASALEAAHERGLVHRDVKPANVLVAARGGGEHVYLTDFGLTKRSASESGLTSAGEWVGTLDYVAPEQLRGDPVDGRADVYALGCVLYETLTGQVPFPREDDVAKLWAHISDTPPLATELAPEVPRRLAGVARRAMEKDPDDRFASARDMGRAALAAVPGGGDTGARARLAASRSAPPRARRRLRGRALLAVLAVLAAIAGVAVLLLSDDDDGADEAASVQARGARAAAPPAAEIVGRPIPVGDAPSAITVTPAGGIWVANTGAESVTFIDSRRPRVRSRIPVGEDPKAISAGPASVWVANFGDSSVTRIDIGGPARRRHHPARRGPRRPGGGDGHSVGGDRRRPRAPDRRSHEPGGAGDSSQLGGGAGTGRRPPVGARLLRRRHEPDRRPLRVAERVAGAAGPLSGRRRRGQHRRLGVRGRRGCAQEHARLRLRARADHGGSGRAPGAPRARQALGLGHGFRAGRSHKDRSACRQARR
jgi:hypothetical protein